MSLSGVNPSSNLLPKTTTIITNPSFSFVNPTLNIPSPSSKLHQYFGSSQYLSSQEQLSIFIEDFPIIDIQTLHKSINQIIPLLIKQNELLAKKCQTQVMLIKESFQKHEALSKKNCKVKEQVEMIQAHSKELIKQKQQQLNEVSKTMEALNVKLSMYNQFINTQNTIFSSILANDFKKCEQLLNSRSIRVNYNEFFILFKEQQAIKPQQFATLQLIQKYCKQTRRRYKCYSKVRSSVEEFCNRLIKITTIVPPQILSKELTYQCEQFSELIKELIVNEVKRKREGSIGIREKERSNDNSRLSNANSDSILVSRPQQQPSISNPTSLIDSQQTIFLRPGSSFQNILSNYISQTTKKFSETTSKLQKQLNQTKYQFQTSKEYYENYLINLKLEYENEKRTLDEQLLLKEEMVRHFQEELEKCFSGKQELANRLKLMGQESEKIKIQNEQVTKKLQQIKRQMLFKDNQLATLNAQLETQRQLHNAKLTNQQQQIQQSFKKQQNRYKLQQQQLQQQLNKKNILINQKQLEAQSIKKELRQKNQKIQDKNMEITKMAKRLQELQEDQVNKLEKRIQELETEILEAQAKKKDLKLLAQDKQKKIDELNHELTLNTTYVKELQAKIQKKDEAIEKLNKKLSNLQMEKKSTSKYIQANQKLQMQLTSSNNQLKKLYQENSGLKRLVKQMKKELQEVSETISGLKLIEKQREKLLIENQKSQRWKQEIMKDYDELKFQILKVQSQNKNLALELKHYRNALKRIQMIN